MEVVGVDSTTPLADSILEHVGSMYTAIGKPAEGLPFFVRSIDIQEELLGKVIFFPFLSKHVVVHLLFFQMFKNSYSAHAKRDMQFKTIISVNKMEHLEF